MNDKERQICNDVFNPAESDREYFERRKRELAPVAGSGLSPFAGELLAAIRALVKDYEPHPCGGFNIDDMRWRLGKIFEPDETMHEALDELLRAKLVRYMGEDDEAAYPCCYGPNDKDDTRPRNL